MEQLQQLPQCIEIESSIVGTLLVEKTGLIEFFDSLSEDYFYSDIYRTIFTSIKELYNRDEYVDIMTVTVDLQNKKLLDLCGGTYAITTLTSRITGHEHLETHIAILKQKWMLRKLIRLAETVKHDAYNQATDVKDLLDLIQKTTYDISQGCESKDAVHISEIGRKRKQELEERKKHPTDIIKSGFTYLDKKLHEFQKTDLIIIAARPSMGKTTFASAIIRNLSIKAREPVAFVSLEMNSLQIYDKFLSQEFSGNIQDFRSNNLTEEESIEADAIMDSISTAPLWIDDSSGMSITQLKAKARRWKTKFNIKVLIVDYLQLITANFQNFGSREEAVREISRTLKQIAKELVIPVIALAQLNRQVENRVDKRPQLSDLRESGAIEQDADVVILLNRPEKYMTTFPDGNPTKGIAEIIVAKHRTGETADVQLRFEAAKSNYFDIEPEDNPPF